MKIYDDIFRTLSERNPALLIPVINAVFSTNYEITEKLDLLSGEHHILSNADSQDTEEIITDSCIRLKNKLYHIECQSNPDGSMVEYDFYIALEHATKVGELYEMEFPQSAVLYLRHTDKTPDLLKMNIRFPNDENISYQVPIFKTQKLSVDELLSKKLFFIIPYYILRYEKTVESVDKEKLVQEYQTLYDGMKDALTNGILNEYDMTNIVQFTNKLVDFVLKENEEVRREVTGIMGGQVLETYADKYAKEYADKEIKKQAKDVALYLISEGKDIEEIAKVLHLTVEEIEELCFTKNG